MTYHRAAVLGSPIQHSLSPVLHNAAYRALGLTGWEYDKREISQEDLHDFFSSLNPQWAGVSMTMPLKKKALEFGEIADERVRHLKVANTAVFDWDKPNPYNPNMPYIALYNTDVDGIKLTFRDEFGVEDTSKPHTSALILGSGSTATSSIAALIELGVHRFTICAIHHDSAVAIATKMHAYANAQSTFTIMPWHSAINEFSRHNFAVSAVTAHATDTLAHELECADEHDIKLDHLSMLDVIYDPRPTALMSVLAQRGAQVCGGEHMLLRQAIAQIAYMTKYSEADVESQAFAAMKSALFEQL
ncbi:shikimate dehydrogenase family protein [Alloscardovia venturai]|uniref:Shikimate dehydrogenase family protein n=1 Tax=Alloscardovia venturai TaxID=1769421 RepID=A0ABW2Y5I6_9BIFI